MLSEPSTLVSSPPILEFGPVIAQLSSSDPNLPCYEETFLQANVIQNNTKQFKAKTP